MYKSCVNVVGALVSYQKVIESIFCDVSKLQAIHGAFPNGSGVSLPAFQGVVRSLSKAFSGKDEPTKLFAVYVWFKAIFIGISVALGL